MAEPTLSKSDFAALQAMKRRMGSGDDDDEDLQEFARVLTPRERKRILKLMDADERLLKMLDDYEKADWARKKLVTWASWIVGAVVTLSGLATAIKAWFK